MKTLPHSTAKDVFSHLLAVASLYVAVVSVITLYFQYINVQFPDPLQFNYLGVLDAIRAAMAALIVVWPVFIGMSWLIEKDLKVGKERRDIAIRKWLIYLTLFITAITIMVDLGTLVNFFLNGSITIQFILKVATVLVVASSVFAYYLWDLQRGAVSKSRVPKVVAIVTSIVVLGSIVLGFAIVGTPGKQRQVRFDEQRISDLSALYAETNNYYTMVKTLPADLQAIKNRASYVNILDPETGATYEYLRKDDVTFALCANFATDTVIFKDKHGREINQPYRGSLVGNENWLHGPGRTCFERKVNPSDVVAPDSGLKQ